MGQFAIVDDATGVVTNIAVLDDGDELPAGMSKVAVGEAHDFRPGDRWDGKKLRLSDERQARIDARKAERRAEHWRGSDKAGPPKGGAKPLPKVPTVSMELKQITSAARATEIYRRAYGRFVPYGQLVADPENFALASIDEAAIAVFRKIGDGEFEYFTAVTEAARDEHFNTHQFLRACIKEAFETFEALCVITIFRKGDMACHNTLIGMPGMEIDESDGINSIRRWRVGQWCAETDDADAIKIAGRRPRGA